MSRCIDLLQDNGELIFITPRDFIKQTSAKKMNDFMFQTGSFTHFEDLGDSNLFGKYSPNCAIWRWVKGLYSDKLADGTDIQCVNGQVIFSKNTAAVLSDIFDVKVGAVSGADDVFEHNTPVSLEFVCSKTATTGQTKKMIYNKKHKKLELHKTRLLNRKIRKFTEDNWWQWGRSYHQREGQRIYVNCKTRNKKPFFISDIPAYDGSVLALFSKSKVNLQSFCDRLNDMDWKSLGFMCGGRHIFSQRSLSNLPI